MRDKRLYTPQAVRESIERGGLRLTKSLGQNFLQDGNIVRKIADTAEISEEDICLEVGPGIGTLTEELSLRAHHVIAVEIDKHLIPVLSENLAWRENITIHHGDILKTDIHALVAPFIEEGRKIKVVANLPYYITTPILTNLLAAGELIESITAMMQREVAERIVAPVGSSNYGSLSVYMNHYANTEISFIVPPKVFVPPPKVESAVVHFTRKPGGKMEEEFFAFVRAGFGQRRKTLVNSIHHNAGFEKEQIRSALLSLGLSEDVRAQALTGEEFQKLYLLLRG